MKATNKISTLRANGISVFNSPGVCRIASSKAFSYGEKLVCEKASQDDYRIIIRGNYSTTLPKPISFV